MKKFCELPRLGSDPIWTCDVLQIFEQRINQTSLRYPVRRLAVRSLFWPIKEGESDSTTLELLD
jgi:hypothetical protein